MRPAMRPAIAWGDWVKERASHLGFRRQIDLAVAVGCTQFQLSRWIQLPEPPRSMRKGFDRSLARALKVDVNTLFTGYREIKPTIAPEINPQFSDESLRRDVVNAVMSLPIERLKIVDSVARGLKNLALAS